MADVVEQWRERARSAVHRTSIPFGAIVQALPDLLLLGQRFRESSRRYAMVEGMAQDVRILDQIAALAKKRQYLMMTRAHVAQDSLRVVRGLRRDNLAIFALQLTITAGKLAELYLGMARWASALKSTIDKAKAAIDGAKVVVASVESYRDSDKNSPWLAGGQAAALVLRLTTSCENLAKIAWDGCSTARRYNSMRDWVQLLSTTLNAIKAVVDQFAVLLNYLGSDSANAVKRLGVEIGGARDLFDAGRAFIKAIQALQEVSKTYAAEEMLLRESEGYIGIGEIMSLRNDMPYRLLNPVDVVSDATSVTAATSLFAAVRQESERLSRSMDMMGSYVTQHAIQLHTALHRLKPVLDEVEEAISSMSLQIFDLEFVINQGGQNAAAAKSIHDSLVGYRDSVWSLLAQVHSVALLDAPEAPAAAAPPPVPLQ